MAAVRKARAVWSGELASGSGQVSAESSGAFQPLPITWASRTQRAEGKTSPEELLAAAHASCFAMALSHGLGSAGTPPEKLEVTAEVTFEQVGGGFRVKSSALHLVGVVPGVDDEAFAKAAEEAKNGCPISKALAGNVELSVAAQLQEAYGEQPQA